LIILQLLAGEVRDPPRRDRERGAGAGGGRRKRIKLEEGSGFC